MTEFLKFFCKKSRVYPIQLKVYYEKGLGVCVSVYNAEGDKEILFVHGLDIGLVFAKAQVQLKEWLLENEGGY